MRQLSVTAHLPPGGVGRHCPDPQAKTPLEPVLTTLRKLHVCLLNDSNLLDRSLLILVEKR
jgi:hypothetical protein